MNPTAELDRLGQRLWLDNITRDLLVSGTLQPYIRDFAITGLTSNLAIFDHAIRNTALYDEAIRERAARGHSTEARITAQAFDKSWSDLMECIASKVRKIAKGAKQHASGR